MHWEWLAGSHLLIYLLTLVAAGISAYRQMPLRDWTKFMAFHAGIMCWLWPVWLALYLSRLD